MLFKIDVFFFPLQVDAIVARNHFDVVTVEDRQSQIGQQCDDLELLLKTKKRDLTFALELHRFLRQANTVRKSTSNPPAAASMYAARRRELAIRTTQPGSKFPSSKLTVNAV